MAGNVNMLQGREYMTALYRRRSVIALCCCLLTLALAFYGVMTGIHMTFEMLGANGFLAYMYFTMIANTLAAVSVAFVIPFAVEGIRKNGSRSPDGCRFCISVPRPRSRS